MAHFEKEISWETIDLRSGKEYGASGKQSATAQAKELAEDTGRDFSVAKIIGFVEGRKSDKEEEKKKPKSIAEEFFGR